MARSDDKKDDKRKSSAPQANGGRKKATGAKAASNGTPPAAPRKKTAKPTPAGPKVAPRARRASPAPAGKPTPTKAKSAAPTPVSKPTAAKPAKAATARRATTKPAPAKAPASRPASRKRAATAKPTDGAPAPAPALDEEERIEDAKYQPRAMPRRLFEEERFIFPDSYGQSRIRLLVKDPDWLFAHWDVDPQSLADLRAELGERASALSSFTLRVVDPQHGGESRVLLPEGARSWYVRADTVQRSYRAELGLTLPSGEFRSLAQSNVVTTPRTGPARVGGPRRMRYDGATPPATEAAPAAPDASTSAPSGAPSPAGPGPWRPDPSTTSYPGPDGRGERPVADRGTSRPGEPSGGASDVYRR